MNFQSISSKQLFLTWQTTFSQVWCYLILFFFLSIAFYFLSVRFSDNKKKKWNKNTRVDCTNIQPSITWCPGVEVKYTHKYICISSAETNLSRRSVARVILMVGDTIKRMADQCLLLLAARSYIYPLYKHTSTHTHIHLLHYQHNAEKNTFLY